MKRLLICVLALSLTFSVAWTHAEGLLPSLTETIGKPMPSYGEALECYPDNETSNDDGSVTEQYLNVSEEQFNTFSVYLEKEGAVLQEYTVDNGVLTATIVADDATFFLRYDSQKSEMMVTYPAGTFDEWTQNAKARFEAAQKLLADGKMDEAYAEILAIPQFWAYGPIDNDLASAARDSRYAPYKEIGSIIKYGTYPQTSSGTDQTSIEWIVLNYDEENHHVLLISKYCLDAVPYNTRNVAITWEKCTLRNWLNNDFLNKAFTTEEQSAILTVLTGLN